MSEVKVYIAKNEVDSSDAQWQNEMGKVLLKRGLRDWLCDENFVPNVKEAKGGKPYLVNCDLHFNISHSQRYVVCAIGEVELGIDVQFHKRNNVDAVAKKIMSEVEWQGYQEASDKANYFYDLWARKESFLKFTGDGIISDMHMLDINARVQEIAVEENYSCMLCTADELSTIIKPIMNVRRFSMHSAARVGFK